MTAPRITKEDVHALRQRIHTDQRRIEQAERTLADAAEELQQEEARIAGLRATLEQDQRILDAALQFVSD
jgi:predicted  nucleic acid-binding Zn-ribbon protein